MDIVFVLFGAALLAVWSFAKIERQTRRLNLFDALAARARANEPKFDSHDQEVLHEAELESLRIHKELAELHRENES